MVAPDRRRAQVMPRLHVGEEYLIKLIRVGQQFVVIDLHDERNFVRQYLRATEPRIPKVVATALQPPSIASFTIFSPSK